MSRRMLHGKGISTSHESMRGNVVTLALDRGKLTNKQTKKKSEILQRTRLTVIK